MRGFSFLEAPLDRQIVYPSAIPQDSDILSTNRNMFVGLGYALLDILGSNLCVAGLPCTQTVVPSLAVLIGPGRIYGVQNVDSTAYGSLPADTTDQIMKQGIQTGSVTLATPAPGTVGQSINYLVQAAYTDSDATPVVLPYYNASNPAVPFSGPGNSGTPQNTQRRGVINLQVKAGVAAATGTQTTPAADPGFVGIYIVTVANGQANVTAGNITTTPFAPIIGLSLGSSSVNIVNANGGWSIHAPVGGVSTLSLQGNGATFGVNDFLIQQNAAGVVHINQNANAPMTFAGFGNVQTLQLIVGGMGFNGTNAIAKPTVSGSKAGNAALTSLMSALSSYGLVTDTTT
jgi:hypothetical protein